MTMDHPYDDTAMMQAFLQQEFDRIVEEGLGDWEQWGHEGKGRNRVLIKTWFFTRDLEKSLATQMLTKIRQSVRTRHKLRVRWAFCCETSRTIRKSFITQRLPLVLG